MQQYQQLPLFPLTAHIMPGGRMKLKVFEPRYTRLVKDCLQSDSEFVVAMFNNEHAATSDDYLLPYATTVKIIDFEPRDDGLLGITVEGKNRVRIDEHWSEKDKLRFGKIEYLENWPELSLDANANKLKTRLQEAFETYPELSELLPDLGYEKLDWICSRWLEILPLDVYTKQELIRSENCLKAKEYLLDLIR
ncbi:LON peptidase substrate-binding domain-containing protein [Idiomarina sp. HP20-50]|uniref:LON peptidase substrate-binding domain-containing protein n=1 Tax=Idiomarina sp. HP20-50 TaxID=3070813 RepID=UPI00294AD69A|nr:LON peptidase substrate-binding domain-containing protein [Idiomarina sp. HP20-50]MDV6315012.1 LON peptidase substrate-binding domain-containing protein [Idiomarina sp. HP20-50]